MILSPRRLLVVPTRDQTIPDAVLGSRLLEIESVMNKRLVVPMPSNVTIETQRLLLRERATAYKWVVALK